MISYRSDIKYNKPLAIGILAIALVTVLLRYFARRMYDLHIDEITYAHLAKTIEAGGLPRNYGGAPFFLHPPGYFALLSIWRAIFWHGGNIFNEYIVLRGMNFVLAGLSVPFLVLIVKMLTRSGKLALLAGALFALDPFVIRQNTRGLMETLTMLFLLIGFWLLLRNVGNPAATKKKLWLWTGFAFGLAMVTKDVAVNFTVIAFLLMAIRKVGPEKRAFRYLIPAAVTPYGVWLIIVTISGHAGDFLSQKTLGVQRFLGLLQTTGFNSKSSPSKGGTIATTIPHYATSYAIMALGAAFSIWLLFSKDRNRRLWGCVGTASTILLCYMFVGGTFEEQYLYYLIVPSIISVFVGCAELMQVINVSYRQLVKVAATAGVVVALSFGVVSYATNVSKNSTGWQSTIEWINNNVPDNSTICTFSQGQFLLNSHGYNVCDYGSMSAIRANHVQYIIVSEKLTYLNYEPLSPGTYKQAKKDSTVVYSTYSPDGGTFKVIKMDNPGTPNYELADGPKSIAPSSSPGPAPTAAGTALPAASATLPNTGISIASSIKLFITSTIVATATSYAYFLFKNQKRPVKSDAVPAANTRRIGCLATLATKANLYDQA